jgi:hypothetical protein
MLSARQSSALSNGVPSRGIGAAAGTGSSCALATNAGSSASADRTKHDPSRR